MAFVAANIGRARVAVARRFQTLLERIAPLDSESGGYRRHQTSIETALGLRTRVIGSGSRSTSIRGFSDLDLLATVPLDQVRSGRGKVRSDLVLRRVREALDRSFDQTDVRRDGQAAVVHFAGGDRSVDVVPGVFHGMQPLGPLGTSRPLFDIPTGNGKWQSTSPEAHNEYIAEAHLRSGSKLKPVARIVKYWRKCRSPEIPLQSFHAELVLACTGVCIGAKPYSECVRDAFGALAARDGRGLRDPLGISPTIPAATTPRGAKDCLNAVARAFDHAQRAVEAECSGDFQEARRQWQIVFNGNFPR